MSPIMGDTTEKKSRTGKKILHNLEKHRLKRHTINVFTNFLDLNTPIQSLRIAA